ncbi:hypothetical protein [Parabacteroides sp. FAFU027]|uniref:hypothetical protein n=1 Tax=Parabacteroides sp. FAFU027 TaxID=2922715 RepID=UPI001FAF0E2C|nr:hypothetical protein [Parabacteroides sp. FAFU027]
MRKQKIRGHNRRQRQIELWRLENLNLNVESLESFYYVYSKMVVHPWCDLSILNSIIPAPKGKTRQLILEGLLDIYQSWKEQLDKSGKPYYLKIWLYEPRFSKSQVVCAVGERIAHYETLFDKPEKNKIWKSTLPARIKDRFSKLNCGYSWDEECYGNDYVGSSEAYASLSDYEA